MQDINSLVQLKVCSKLLLKVKAYTSGTNEFMSDIFHLYITYNFWNYMILPLYSYFFLHKNLLRSFKKSYFHIQIFFLNIFFNLYARYSMFWID